jgi:hypothetical protein
MKNALAYYNADIVRICNYNASVVVGSLEHYVKVRKNLPVLKTHMVTRIEILVLERVPMFELLLQTFWAKKTLVKSLLISTLDKVIYYIGTFLQGSTKPLYTTQNRVETS